MEGVVGPPIILVDGDIVRSHNADDAPVLRLPPPEKRKEVRLSFKGPVIDYGIDEDQVPPDPRTKR
eukprot:1257319-Rhodomonas_salina.1